MKVSVFGVRLGFPGKEFLFYLEKCKSLFDFQITFNPEDTARFFLMISRVFGDL